MMVDSYSEESDDACSDTGYGSISPGAQVRKCTK